MCGWHRSDPGKALQCASQLGPVAWSANNRSSEDFSDHPHHPLAPTTYRYQLRRLATASEIDLEIERRPHSSLGGAASGIVVHSSSEVTSGGESTGCCGLGPALIRVNCHFS